MVAVVMNKEMRTTILFYICYLQLSMEKQSLATVEEQWESCFQSIWTTTFPTKKAQSFVRVICKSTVKFCVECVFWEVHHCTFKSAIKFR